MYRQRARHGKSSLVCVSLSRQRLRPLFEQPRSLLVAFALLIIGALAGQASAGVRAIGIGENEAQTTQAQSTARRNCATSEETQQALVEATGFMQQSRFTDAASILQPLAQQLCDKRLSLLLAAAYEGMGHDARSRQALEQAHVRWPADTSISTSLARTYLAEKQVEKATAALAHFHADSSTTLQEMDLATVVFLAGHQLPAAQHAAEQAYKLYPSVKSLLLLANTLQLQGKYKKVIAMLGAQRDTFQNSSPFLITLAESEYDALQFDTARTDLEHAIAFDSSLYQGHFLLGNVLFKLGDLDHAIVEYRSALQLAPEQPRTYCQLALVLEAKDDPAGAEQVLLKAIAADEHYAPAHLELGKLLLNRSQATEALEQLKLALADNPQLEQAYFLLAKTYAQIGDQPRSAVMARKLVEVRTANHQNLETSTGEPGPSQ
jgi:tetratricopeptide (TPR) repeat protein